MQTLTWLLAGGFAKGYRTQILAGLGIITCIANFAMGDMTLQDAINNIWGGVLSASVATGAEKIARANTAG